MRRGLFLALVIAVSLAAGFCGGWVSSERSLVPDMALMDDLGTLVLCQGALKLSHEDETQKRARYLLVMYMNMALDDASMWVDEGASLGGVAAPNLLDGLDRTAARYEELGDQKRQEAALALAERLRQDDSQ